MSADIVDLGIVELPEWETAFSADGERLISREIGNSLSLIEATLVRKGLSETEAKRVTWYPCDYQEVRRAVLARRAGEHEKADGYRVLVMWPDGEEETWTFEHFVGWPTSDRRGVLDKDYFQPHLFSIRKRESAFGRV